MKFVSDDANKWAMALASPPSLYHFRLLIFVAAFAFTHAPVPAFTLTCWKIFAEQTVANENPLGKCHQWKSFSKLSFMKVIWEAHCLIETGRERVNSKGKPSQSQGNSLTLWIYFPLFCLSCLFPGRPVRICLGMPRLPSWLGLIWKESSRAELFAHSSA